MTCPSGANSVPCRIVAVKGYLVVRLIASRTCRKLGVQVPRRAQSSLSPLRKPPSPSPTPPPTNSTSSSSRLNPRRSPPCSPNHPTATGRDTTAPPLNARHTSTSTSTNHYSIRSFPATSLSIHQRTSQRINRRTGPRCKLCIS